MDSYDCWSMQQQEMCYCTQNLIHYADHWTGENTEAVGIDEAILFLFMEVGANYGCVGSKKCHNKYHYFHVVAAKTDNYGKCSDETRYAPIDHDKCKCALCGM